FSPPSFPRGRESRSQVDYVLGSRLRGNDGERKPKEFTVLARRESNEEREQKDRIMQFSENWLRTMVDPKLTSDELSHLLTMSGLEVEDVDPVAPPFSNVVVAKVLDLVKHPNADKLKVCTV